MPKPVSEIATFVKEPPLSMAGEADWRLKSSELKNKGSFLIAPDSVPIGDAHDPLYPSLYTRLLCALNSNCELVSTLYAEKPSLTVLWNILFITFPPEALSENSRPVKSLGE